MTTSRLLHLVGFVLLSLAANAAELGIALPGTDGHEHEPLKVPAGKKAVVLVFGSPYCNTSNTFLPELNAITEAFEDRFSFYLVHADPDLELTQVLEHKELLNVRALAVLDKQQRLVARTGARVTPEVAVLSASGETLYQGRINDLYLGPTKRQRKATTSDLRDALEALAQGQAVKVPRTEAVGCKIAGGK
jgi:thiol-disulfide isomerase/thioredoxin